MVAKDVVKKTLISNDSTLKINKSYFPFVYLMTQQYQYKAFSN